MSLRGNERSLLDNNEGNVLRPISKCNLDNARLGLSSSGGNLDGIRYPDSPAAKASLPGLFLFGRAESKAEQLLCRADAVKEEAEPSTEKARNEVHDVICANLSRLNSDLNSSNEAMQVPRALAEGTLRVLSIGTWGGTGISKHVKWQDEVDARKAVIAPGKNKNGTIDVGPEKWEACFDDVQKRLDHNRKWANCAERSASACHVIEKMIINHPDTKAFAGLQVCQCYTEGGHSFSLVKYPNGKEIVYDLWKRQTGALEDFPADYREAKRSPWYGRK
jgi:hypothetical protein